MELRRLRASLCELPQLCREAYLLNRIEELSHAEIAERLGVSARTVDRYMARARLGTPKMTSPPNPNLDNQTEARQERNPCSTPYPPPP